MSSFFGYFVAIYIFFFVTFSQQSSLICIHRKACAKSAHQTKHRHSRTQKKEQESRAFLCTQKKNNEEYPSISFCRLIPSALWLGAAKLHPLIAERQEANRGQPAPSVAPYRYTCIYIEERCLANAYGRVYRMAV